jgi:WYL_2, Sm-like SH3 beta-barrel fold
MQFEINALKEMLARGPMTFIFRKKDGSVRRMTATTNKEWIPGKERIVQRSEKAITVYDMEKEAFRNVSVDAFVCA